MMAHSGDSSAETITFAFTGIVESVFDGLGALGGSVHEGAEFRGRYVFDSETPNTAPPVAEGDAGLYHHDASPAGVVIRLGTFWFRSTPADPDFDVIVNDEVGVVGVDAYGFTSRENEAHGLLPSAPIGLLEVGWLAETTLEDP